MESKTYYIFRHGETYYSKNGVSYGENEYTAKILPEAKPVVERIATYLKREPVELFIRSELLRCQETAEIIENKVSQQFKPDSLLNESLELSFTDFQERMVRLATKLQKEKKNYIAICTHGAVIAALQRLLLGKDFEIEHLPSYPKTGVVVKIKNEVIEKLDFNNDTP